MKTTNMKEKTQMGKQLKQGIAVMLLACLIAMASIGVALAGGGVNHKTKVTNSSDNDVTVVFVYGMDVKTQEYRINKNAQHTFESGAKCPVGLQGYVHGANVKMVTRCIVGTEKGGGDVRDSCGSVSCWSSDWTIRKHDTGAYHFDKE